MVAIYPVIIAVVIAADQITKYMIRANLQLGEKLPVFQSLLGDWFNITYIRNTGAAFSMFSGNKLVTVALTLVLIIACSIFIAREIRSGSRTLALCLTFVIAGGTSNLIDRLWLGWVTDMISCGSFAIFNVADIAVTCGCCATVLILLLDIRGEMSGSDKAAPDADKEAGDE